MDFNPWNVSCLEEFLYYNCPECEGKFSNREQFAGHAVVAHKKARDILMKILVWIKDISSFIIVEFHLNRINIVVRIVS